MDIYCFHVQRVAFTPVARSRTYPCAAGARAGVPTPALWRRQQQLRAQTRRAAAVKSAPVLESLSQAAGDVAVRLARLAGVQPPPPGFPPGPAGDQSVALLTDPLGLLRQLRAQHGPVVGMLLGGERVVLVACPDTAAQVLVSRADVFCKEGTAFFPGSSLTGSGLLTSDGELWRRQRRMANPAFRRAAVDSYAAEMVTATQTLMKGAWASTADSAEHKSKQDQQDAQKPRPQHGVRDVYADFNELTLRITLAALFGMRGDNGSAARIVSAVQRAFAFLAARGASAAVLPEWLPTPDNVAFTEAVRELDELVYGIIDARSRNQSTTAAAADATGTHARPADLLQSLLDARDEAGAPMPRAALRDELMTLLVAGQETSAIVLGWASALLAAHPATQAAAAAEACAVLRGAAPAAEDVGRLPRITAVVLEALRLYSPAYMVGRCASRDVELVGGYRLPKGTTVLVSPYLLHREPSRWRQPAVFNPDRWLPLLQQQAAISSSSSSSSSSTGSGAPGGCPMHNGASQGVSSSSGSSGSSSSSSSSSGSSSSSSSSGGSCPVHASSQQQPADNATAATTTSTSSTPTCGAGAGGGVGYAALLSGLGPNGAFVPFGAGPRNCIGTGFAMTEAVLVLAVMLQDYSLAPPRPAAGMPRPAPALTLRPESVPLRLRRRKH